MHGRISVAGGFGQHSEANGFETRIDLYTAVLGGEARVPTLAGSNLIMKVRPGTSSGTMVRLRGQGMPHLKDEKRGDLFARIQIDVPEKLSSEQQKLFEELRARA